MCVIDVYSCVHLPAELSGMVHVGSCSDVFFLWVIDGGRSGVRSSQYKYKSIQRHSGSVFIIWNTHKSCQFTFQHNITLERGRVLRIGGWWITVESGLNRVTHMLSVAFMGLFIVTDILYISTVSVLTSVDGVNSTHYNDMNALNFIDNKWEVKLRKH